MPDQTPRSPDLHPLLARILDLQAGKSLVGSAPDEARADVRTRSQPLLAAFKPTTEITDFSIDGPGGPLNMRLFMPADAEGPLPVILFFHGGGWVLCDLDTHSPLANALAQASGAAVLMVDYRLAPEHPFPAALEDGLAAIDWVATHAAGNDLDGSRLVLAGDSAGGNLAAVLARGCRDRAGPPISGQYLLYPVIDLPDPERWPSYAAFADYGLDAPTMAWFWHLYAGGAAPGDDLLPLQAKLEGLPPALVQTAQFDVLRDEGEAYGAALAQAGVAVSAERWPGMNHGFASLVPLLPEAGEAIASAGGWLRRLLA